MKNEKLLLLIAVTFCTVAHYVCKHIFCFHVSKEKNAFSSTNNIAINYLQIYKMNKVI